METFSERMFHGLNGLMEQSIKIFCACQNITKHKYHAEQQQSKDFFRFFSNSVGGREEESGVVCKVQNSVRVKRVLKPGLVLLSQSYKTRVEILEVASQKGYATIRHVLSSSCLAGPKKRWPPVRRNLLSTIPLYIDRDVVRCVDVPPSEKHFLKGSGSEAAINKVRFLWDPATRKCKSTYEASEVPANNQKIATALQLVPVLVLEDEKTEEEIADELLAEVDVVFFYNSNSYTIQKVDTLKNTVIATPRGGGGEQTQFCLATVENILHNMLK